MLDVSLADATAVLVTRITFQGFPVPGLCPYRCRGERGLHIRGAAYKRLAQFYFG